MKRLQRASWVAWCLAAAFYFYQYALRSAPAVMMPQISAAFGLGAGAAASLVGLFYHGYALFSLVAGATLDRLGARLVIPPGAVVVGCGALLFGAGGFATANLGRLLQGVGGAFAFVGVVYIANRSFPPSRAATLTGAAQMFGMAGASAGQFVVGPLLVRGVPWNRFWIGMGIAGLFIALVLFFALPAERMPVKRGGSMREALRSLGIILRNPQSILCGAIAGLLFVPTTIFDMTWGVRYLQEAHGFDYGAAVMRSAMVPLGWIIGSPLLGLVSDRLGRRKPVIIGAACAVLACLAWILYGPVGVFPPYVLGLMTGIASGGAMIPYTVIKEANPPNLSGTAIGVVNFLNLMMTALLGPVFGWLLQSMSGGMAPGREQYQGTFQFLLLGAGLAALLTLALKETGRAASAPMVHPEAA